MPRHSCRSFDGLDLLPVLKWHSVALAVIYGLLRHTDPAAKLGLRPAHRDGAKEGRVGGINLGGGQHALLVPWQFTSVNQ